MSQEHEMNRDEIPRKIPRLLRAVHENFEKHEMTLAEARSVIRKKSIKMLIITYQRCIETNIRIHFSK